MPGMDSTGPFGTGPVGRGLGPCGGGLGVRAGLRGRRGFGRFGWNAFSSPISVAEEKVILEQQKELLDRQIQITNQRLQDLEKQDSVK